MASESGAGVAGIPPRSLLLRPGTWLRDGGEGPRVTVRETEEGLSGQDGSRMVALCVEDEG